MADSILFWHRRDLRLHDNLGLAQARQHSPKVIGVFCFDPQILQGDDVAAVRVTYLVESLRLLQHGYEEAGGQLLIFHASPQVVLPQLASILGVRAVIWNQDVEPYAKERDRTVESQLQTQNITVETIWDQLLHSPETVLTKEGQPYTVYTPFWRNWQQHYKAQPISLTLPLEGLTPSELEQVQQLGAIALPSAKELDFAWDGDLILSPGEQAASTQLQTFCDRALWDYGEQRNFPAVEGTSLLSPALKFGTIGIRTLWAATQDALEHCRSDEARANIETWQKELAWREFYQHALYHFPGLAEAPYREQWKTFPWNNQEEYFQAWCEGQTGYPIVDAAMRQLKTTGWMHNRCRMIVASFLTKDLIINWQWGEKYFMQTLIDGDLASNNGGWQWSASSGMDSKPLRIFNPTSQTQKYDSEATFIRQWLPELASLETEEILSGELSPETCDRVGYPTPIVNHNHQQHRFKQLYNQQKIK